MLKLIDDVIHHNNLKLFGCAATKVSKGKQQLTYLKYGMMWDFSHGFTLLSRLEIECWSSSFATKFRLHLHHYVMVVNSTYV